jgi:hypothetical protein
MDQGGEEIKAPLLNIPYFFELIIRNADSAGRIL